MVLSADNHDPAEANVAVMAGRACRSFDLHGLFPHHLSGILVYVMFKHTVFTLCSNTLFLHYFPLTA
jgi:hypothetical protein